MTQSAPPEFFFIIGAMKAGTTSLYKYLAGHPELFASPRKEPRVFRDAGDPTSQRRTFESLFAERRDERWCFEASTAYTKFPRIAGVPRRIQAAAPDARFVYLVRNPIDRTWSHYVHNVAAGRESRRFDKALAASPQYLDISRYYLQLMQYYEVFPRERVLVVAFEDMVRQPAATVRAVCEFLRVDPSYTPSTSEIAYNASSTKQAAPIQLRLARRLGVAEAVPPPFRRWLKHGGAALPSKKVGLTPQVRARLAESFAPDTEQLFALLGRRIAWEGFA